MYFQSPYWHNYYFKSPYWQTGAYVGIIPKTDTKSGGVMLGIKQRFKEKRTDSYRDQILREDNEILEVIMAFVLGNN